MKRQIARHLADEDSGLSGIRAVVVSVDGRRQVEVYRDSVAEESSHVFSVTKSVLSLLIGVAVGEGKLSLDASLPELLPDRAGQLSESMAKVTLRDLLTMMSGLPDDAFNLAAPDTIGLVLAYGSTTEPGAQFLYSDASAHLAAAALAQAAGTSVLAYGREKIFDPLGIDTRPAYEGPEIDDAGAYGRARFAWPADRSGVQAGGLGLKMTTRDMAKIGDLVLAEGRWKGRQLVPAEWIRESTSSQVPVEKRGGENDYGYLWWRGELGGHRFVLASGLYNQTIFVVADLGLVVAVSTRPGPDSEIIPMQRLLGDDIIERLEGR